jgi:hypothetical protein
MTAMTSWQKERNRKDEKIGKQTRGKDGIKVCECVNLHVQKIHALINLEYFIFQPLSKP